MQSASSTNGYHSLVMFYRCRYDLVTDPLTRETNIKVKACRVEHPLTRTFSLSMRAVNHIHFSLVHVHNDYSNFKINY